MVWVLNADFHASKIYVQVEGHRPWVLCADFDFKGKAIICDPGEYADVSKVRYKNHINPLENTLPRLPRSPSNPFVSWSTQTLKRRVDSRFASKMPKWSLINHVANLYFKNVPNHQLHKRHRVKIIRWVNLSLFMTCPTYSHLELTNCSFNMYTNGTSCYRSWPSSNLFLVYSD